VAEREAFLASRSYLAGGEQGRKHRWEGHRNAPPGRGGTRERRAFLPLGRRQKGHQDSNPEGQPPSWAAFPRVCVRGGRQARVPHVPPFRPRPGVCQALCSATPPCHPCPLLPFDLSLRWAVACCSCGPAAVGQEQAGVVGWAGLAWLGCWPVALVGRGPWCCWAKGKPCARGPCSLFAFLSLLPFGLLFLLASVAVGHCETASG